MSTNKRQPRFLISKFDGRCADCGRETRQGERVFWRARGEIECGDCAAFNGRENAGATVQPAQPAPQAPSAGDFDPALTWDDTPPSAGASINSRNMAPIVTQPSGPQPKASGPLKIASQRFIDTRSGEIVERVPVHDITHFEKYDGVRKVGEFDTGCDQFKVANDARNASEPVQAPEHAPVVDLAARRIADTVSEPAPDLDALGQTVADLLVTLVNCIDRLDSDQCDALRANALHYAEQSASGSRRRTWQAFARFIA